MEQKTTILWKCLYFLASLKDFSGLGEAYETNRKGGEANLIQRRNTTVNVDKIRGFRPPYVWMRTFVFLHGLTVYQQCVVFCTLSTGTPRLSATMVRRSASTPMCMASACTPYVPPQPPMHWRTTRTLPRCRNGWGMRTLPRHGSTIAGRVGRRRVQRLR